MKVMIVGAAGFLGSTTAVYMAINKNKDFSVIGIDNLSMVADLYNIEPILKSKNRHNFYLADICDHDIMSKILKIEKPDAIVFFAQHPTKSRDSLISDLFASLDTVNPVKLIYVQSEENNMADYTLFENPGRENAIRLVRNYGGIILNTCRIFGGRQDKRYFVPSIAKAFAEGIISFDGVNTTISYEWLYVSDFFSALDIILRNDVKCGSTISINGFYATEAEVVNHIAAFMGFHLPSVSTAFTVSNSMDADHLEQLGWAPRCSLLESLEHTICWYKENGRMWAYRE